MNGKGDTYRKVNKQKYDSNYDQIEWRNKYGKTKRQQKQDKSNTNGQNKEGHEF